MQNLQEEALKYIKIVAPNRFYVTKYEDKDHAFKNAIIKYKNEHPKIEFSLDDFVLVRIVDKNNFPYDFTYHPTFIGDNPYEMENPFYPTLLMLHYDDEVYKASDIKIPQDEIDSNMPLIGFRYRVTKHFSINSLASNVYEFFNQSSIFDTGDFIIIEPLSERINDKRLVNLNPVDTFFDLSKECMPVSKNAIFLIREDSLDEYMKIPFIKERLDGSTLFIYKDNASLATDIVLSYLGYIPQHSFQQLKLKEEYYFLDHNEVSDAEYIKEFQNYIDYLNRRYLNASYFDIPEEIKRKRKKEYESIPGIFHADTKYYLEEDDKRILNDIKIYEEYLRLVFRDIPFVNDNIVREVIASVKRDVLDIGSQPFKRTFIKTSRKFSDLFLKTLIEMSYPKYKELTDKFNQQQLKKVDYKRRG